MSFSRAKTRRPKKLFVSNIDVTESRYGRGGYSATHGSGGDIPQYLLDRKTEKTKINEDPEELYNYQRAMLSYTGPDAPTFEEEETRRDNHSTERLNVRYNGGRSEFEPNHSEAFLGFTEPDPRGTQTEPDVRKIVDQARFRQQRYTKFSPEGPLNVPERERSWREHVKDRRDGFNWYKNRIRDFDDSHDGRHNGGPLGTKLGHDADLITSDEVVKDINKATNIHRGDHTTILSNYYPIGWYRTTDHRFKVSKYGKQYRNLTAGEVDKRVVQNNAITDGNTIVEYKGQKLPKLIVYEMKRMATEEDQKQTPHFMLSLEDKLKLYKSGQRYTGMNHEAFAVSQKMAQSMGEITRKARFDKQDVTEAAQNIQSSAAAPINAETAAMTLSSSQARIKYDAKHRRNIDVKLRPKEAKTANYRTMKPKDDAALRYNPQIDIEGDAPLNPHRKSFYTMNGNEVAPRLGNDAHDTLINVFGEKERHGGNLGNRSFRSYETSDDLQEQFPGY